MGPDVKNGTTRRPRRRTPKQDRSRQTVAAVLDAVTRILDEEGVASLTTNRIAEVAGVSIGSVYQYFPDKRGIFGAVHDRHSEAMGRVLDRTLAEHAGAPTEDVLRAIVGALIEAHAADPVSPDLGALDVPHRPDGPPPLEARLASALRASLPASAEDRGLDRRIFVLSHVIESLAHGAVTSRPAHLSLAAAKEEAVRAVLGYLHAANVSTPP
jgi:AcrR family transcriptional regulator